MWDRTSDLRFLGQQLNHSATAVATQRYYKPPILSVLDITQHPFLLYFRFKISNINLLSATSIRHQHSCIRKADKITKLRFCTQLHYFCQEKKKE